ncbi:DUF2695 domain-containing protein [Lentzea flava]|uniref:DUF2695 domain-containing protein n=1 Tax=Lentzea flava TaxID=103732 RepID=A0ABQ2V5I7_9PSEU|nr:DUF2695 domain-containing protein [Lentzea flava]MCP2203139.1 Protein of unknown function (DUF2695) [Lentzea flava]GGU65910.1 hypothetical protein GCM10010178_67280 [Lentzea flava]
MGTPPDESRRRELRDQYKRAEIQARTAGLPLDREQLTALVEFVDVLVAEEGCDHTLRHTERWVNEHGLAWDPIADALAELGGYCDCEVVMNCGQEEVFG